MMEEDDDQQVIANAGLLIAHKPWCNRGGMFCKLRVQLLDAVARAWTVQSN